MILYRIFLITSIAFYCFHVNAQEKSKRAYEQGNKTYTVEQVRLTDYILNIKGEKRECVYKIKSLGDNTALLNNGITWEISTNGDLYLVSKELYFKNKFRFSIFKIPVEEIENKNKCIGIIKKRQNELFYIDNYQLDNIRNFHERGGSFASESMDNVFFDIAINDMREVFIVSCFEGIILVEKYNPKSSNEWDKWDVLVEQEVNIEGKFESFFFQGSLFVLSKKGELYEVSTESIELVKNTKYEEGDLLLRKNNLYYIRKDGNSSRNNVSVKDVNLFE